MSRLVVMGSGETAPTMVRVHRQVLAESGDGPAVLLDTPFGFQNNADELVSRTSTYFAESVGRAVQVASWRCRDAPVVHRERALALLAEAAWTFAGPGSPTYALRHWRDTPVPAALAEVVRRGGTLVLGSAAACTGGSHAVPVYEIYKVGEDPHWVQGLDLVGELAGVHAALVPHYDNAEGGTHDTRYCYLGERRLARMESDLPDGVGVLGVDEHTALLLDLDAGHAEVTGNGTVTVRRRARSRSFGPGTRLALGDLAALLRGDEALPGGRAEPPGGSAQPAGSHAVERPVADPQPRDAPSLRADADAARTAFDTALAARDVDGCVAAVLGLEQALHDWSADTLQSDDTGHARRMLRAMVVRLGELAHSGAADPREVVAPYVELLLDLRGTARQRRDFTTADLVRERLAAAGVEVRDTADGREWYVSL